MRVFGNGKDLTECTASLHKLAAAHLQAPGAGFMNRLKPRVRLKS